MIESPQGSRAALLRHALRLEWLTIGWNLVEGIVSIAAAVASGSVALLAFGLDSFIESTSGGVLVWRLRSERASTSPGEIERLERRAQRLVAGSLVLLAIYVSIDATLALVRGERPSPSVVGIVVPAVSMSVMWALARAKRRVAGALSSRALAADALQTTACWWLSLATLTGIVGNALFGWWWLDPVAALGIAAILLIEARKAWRAEACCLPSMPSRDEPEVDACCGDVASPTRSASTCSREPT